MQEEVWLTSSASARHTLRLTCGLAKFVAELRVGSLATGYETPARLLGTSKPISFPPAKVKKDWRVGWWQLGAGVGVWVGTVGELGCE